MYFTGEGSRKRIDLSGRSKQDRQRLLEQTRLDRERRQQLRLESQSAITIQRFYRGRRDVRLQRIFVRKAWQDEFGHLGEQDSEAVLHLESKFWLQLLFFFRPDADGDVERLADACRVLLRAGIINNSSIIACEASDDSTQQVMLRHRLGKIALLSLRAVWHHRESLRLELVQSWQPLGPQSGTATVLLEIVLALASARPLFAPAVLRHLAHNGLFCILRDTLLTVVPLLTDDKHRGLIVVERFALKMSTKHLERTPIPPAYTSEEELPPKISFSVQIGCIPLLWQRFPAFAQAAGSTPVWRQMVHALGSDVHHLVPHLPPDISKQLPASAGLLGNLVGAAAWGLAHPSSTSQTVNEFSLLAVGLLEDLSMPLPQKSIDDADEYADGYPSSKRSRLIPLDPALEHQLGSVGDSSTLRHLLRLTLPGAEAASSSSGLAENGGATAGRGEEGAGGAANAPVVGALCAYLHTAKVLLPNQSQRMTTGLAYAANLVPRLWSFLRSAHAADSWPSSGVAPASTLAARNGDMENWMNWLLPLAVFCPVYSYMLATMDNEEFYEVQRPLAFADLAQLIVILRETVWQLLWVAKAKHPVAGVPSNSPLSLSLLRHNVSLSASELLAQLHDRNSKRQFTSTDNFHARQSIEEAFFAQAECDKGRASELLREAPFLVPFAGRVRIYTSMLANVRRQVHTIARGIRLNVRRERIIESSFAQLRSLPPEAWQGTIRVAYVNELGVEEAGVDGGGIFKDFVENITRAVFDVQHGLFKETADHLLYPNPGSQMASSEHLDYFEFVGKILGKAMLEGILVDIPFATFFLSKLKRKYNSLHDLPSLDPELYRSLLFLKHYEGDVSELGLYFVLESSEYGKVAQTELIPGGTNIPVTRENLIRYIWLVAHYRLNIQIRSQSEAFLRGFQALIDNELIAMFNEQELQMLISGSQEGLELQNLQENANYSGGYHERHPVILMLWDVLRDFDTDLQHKFLKFVTGCSRGPLLGFRYLEPHFCVQRAAPEAADVDSLDRLPTAATCMNLLKLPPYRSERTLRDKLVYAITAGAGFDLS